MFDCFGAGQKVAQVTYGGRDWRQAPETAGQMFTVFTIMRVLHELLWYLGEALTLGPPDALRAELERAIEDTERATGRGPEELAVFDFVTHRSAVNGLLQRASELARAGAPRADLDLAGKDLVGRSFRGADLRGASLRGARLVGADLRGADLRSADVTGADVRAADLRGADLTTSLFLVQSQLDAARGDGTTRLPPALSRPAHWSPPLRRTAE